MTNGISVGLRLILINALFFISSQIVAKEVQIITNKDVFIFEIEENTTIKEVTDLANGLKESVGENYVIAFSENQIDKYEAYNYGGPLNQPRDYFTLVTPEEKGNLSFIVTTLADKPLLSLAMMRTDLEMAGERIEHLHPIRFLHTIFTDEVLKVAIKNIRARGWVWNNFINGLKTSFNSENDIGNILEEHVFDLARAVGIDVRLIMSAVKEQQWEKFVDLLVRHVPRQGNPGRYD